MQYRQLGNTNIQLSVICLGTMTFGEQNSETEAHQQLNYALSQGVNFIDTAEMYSIPPRRETQGRTEQYIGTWLKNRQDRDKIILASKAAGPGAHFDYLRGGPKFTKAHLREAVEGSLRRLQTDYIDLYQLHWPERSTNFFGQRGYKHKENQNYTAFREVLEGLAELQIQGKIRHIGVSNETPWGLMQYLRNAELHNLPRVMSIQNSYSLLNRHFEVGLAEIAVNEQVGLLAYSPLAMGMLTGKYLNGAKPEGARLSRWTQYSRYSSPNSQNATAAYVKLAQKHGISPTQMALAFVNQQAWTSSNIIGATTIEQLQENIASINLHLSAELLSEIEQIHEQYPNPAG